MPTAKIVQKDAPVLRQIAGEVPVKDITSKQIKDVITKMQRALSKEDDGVAIAAPQIGVPLRIFVVSGRLLAKNQEEEQPDMVFINPEIVKLSRKKQKMEEGCLSVRWLYGQVERSEKATVRAYDERGKAFTKGASGILAQAFQHEIDHLNGILFIDKATDLQDLPPPDNSEDDNG